MELGAFACRKTKKKEVKSSDEEDQDVEMNLWLIESLKDMATGIAEKEENSHDDLGLVAEAQHDVSEKSRNAEWGSPKDVIERTPLEVCNLFVSSTQAESFCCDYLCLVCAHIQASYWYIRRYANLELMLFCIFMFTVFPNI